jgi:hypothetical protein
VRQIEVDEETATLLEARAESRGITVSELLVDAVEWLDAIIVIDERTGSVIPRRGMAKELPQPRSRSIE